MEVNTLDNLGLVSLAFDELEIQNSFTHLDSTSFHVHGQYDGEDKNEQTVSITHGYSRDHRPDLKQVGLSLICSQIGRIPMLMKPLSGNSNDSRAFREVIQEFGEHLRDVDGVETFVADCALFSEEAVLLMEEQKVRFVTRMIAVRSDDFAERTITTVRKRIGKGLESEYKSFVQLSRQDFACHEDAQKSLEKFQKSLKFLSIEEPVITSRAVYLKPGKPRKNQADLYSSQISLTNSSGRLKDFCPVIKSSLLWSSGFGYPFVSELHL